MKNISTQGQKVHNSTFVTSILIFFFAVECLLTIHTDTRLTCLTAWQEPNVTKVVEKKTTANVNTAIKASKGEKTFDFSRP